MKKLLTVLLALCLCCAPALAAVRPLHPVHRGLCLGDGHGRQSVVIKETTVLPI